MSQDLIDYILGLTEKDAINALLNAKQEAYRDHVWYKKTEPYEAYNQARDLMAAMPQHGHHLTLEHLKFVYCETKLQFNGML